MRVYFYGFIMLFKKFILRMNTGKVILSFVEKMGVVYIKLAQILAMQNYGNLFTENDRILLSKICDHCKPIHFKKIKKIIEKEYGCSIEEKFRYVDPNPVGSASISQVHKAVLKNGDIVALKVRRQDITRKIEKDIKQMKRIVRRYGRIFRFKNILGSDTALDLYLSWILEEVDFKHEARNIVKYSQFAKNVNNKVQNTVTIRVPRVYKKLSNENIIVMEFIFAKTINQMSLSKKNKLKISKSLNDYVKLSFYAFFRDVPVVFHGDPHGGNIYIDEHGSIGFLDMGLIFTIDGEDKKIVKDLFFSAYNQNVDKLIAILTRESSFTAYDNNKFYQDIEECCKRFREIPVTQFFVEMIGVFTKYNMSPPDVLFTMAKAFVALYGINRFIDNKIDTESLLMEQITEYYVNRCVSDIKDVFKVGSSILPKFLQTTLDKGLIAGVSEALKPLGELNKKVNQFTENCNEVLDCFKG